MRTLLCTFFLSLLATAAFAVANYDKSEKTKAIEARRSTDSFFSNSDFTALTATGIRPKNENKAKPALAMRGEEKSDSTRLAEVSAMRAMSNMKKPRFIMQTSV